MQLVLGSHHITTGCSIRTCRYHDGVSDLDGGSHSDGVLHHNWVSRNGTVSYHDGGATS